MLQLTSFGSDVLGRSTRCFSGGIVSVLSLILAGLLTVLTPGSVVRAQVTTADIVGTVTDASGAVLPGVRITVRNLAMAAKYTAVIVNAGDYLVTLLPVGHCSIRPAAVGFRTWTIPEVALAIGDWLRQDIRLELGPIEQSTELTASSPALQSDSSSLSSLINERAVQDHPLNARNFIVLARLVAGANEGENNGLPTGLRPDDRRQTSAVSVNGLPTSCNNFLIDGMDHNERFVGTVMVKPSIHALVEMKVETDLYSAELGRTGAGVINFITKSGTNALHGSLFEFPRNDKLDARNSFNRNTPAFAASGGALGSTSFSVICSTYFASVQRDIQFGLKLLF